MEVSCHGTTPVPHSYQRERAQTSHQKNHAHCAEIGVTQLNPLGNVSSIKGASVLKLKRKRGKKMVPKKATARNKDKKGHTSENVLVISLPAKEGRKIKLALKSLAQENYRSLSNQVSVILSEYLEESGKL